MAVVEMGKLNLVAMSYDKDAVLNALQRTGAAEIKLHSETENTAVCEADCEDARAYLSRTEDALQRLCAETEKFNKQNKVKSGVTKDGFDISYSEFMAAGKLKDEVDATVEKINSLAASKNQLTAELNKIRRNLQTAEIYSAADYSLKAENTAHTSSKLGVVPANTIDAVSSEIDGLELADGKVLGSGKDGVLIAVFAHREAVSRVEEILQNAGFVNCPFDDGRTGAEIYAELKDKEREVLEKIDANARELYSLADKIRNMKVYCDYLGYELEKAETNAKMRETVTTFLLEAYVPNQAEDKVKEALSEVSGAVYFEFSKPSEDETPPTLLNNNKVIKNFEAITNMYSPPSSKEFDPNTVMALFYSVFLGFIMADIGYGLLMILGGVFLWHKNMRRDNMAGRLGGVFAVGGIFTIIWGILFNSFFGFAVLPYKVMPDLQGDAMSWSLAGINVPALLIVSMLIGVIQICVGYVCLAVQCFRRGQILDGIFGGVVWALFSVGAELAIAGFVDQFNVPVLKTVGGIIAGVSLVIAILTAGRKEKLLGKFTKGFGAAYGVINYMSDILSYARLYGLMLAGAVIADIISTKSVGLMLGGNVALVILGAVIMVVGHIFNLAIGLLGAYIHDARLQYVEFYGRFYEGEGRLFTPLGSKHSHVFISG